MNTAQCLEKIRLESEICFSDFIELIDNEYWFINIAFENGTIINTVNENQGSAKVFCFGHMHSLSKQETLKCFGEHYRSVIESPKETKSHLNIRSFIENGWEGLFIDFKALTIKN